MPHHGIEDQRDHETENQIAQESGALRHGAGHDGGGGGTEHQVKEPRRQGRNRCPAQRLVQITRIRRNEEAGESQEGVAVAEHDAETQDPEAQGGHGEVPDVLHHDVGDILGAGKPALDHGKARLHEENQRRRADQDKHERAANEQRQTLIETAEADMHDRESGDDKAKSNGRHQQTDAAQAEGRRRQESGNEGEGDGVLVNIDEDQRRRERDQKPADESAGRDQQVEACQIGGGRAKPSKGAVAVKRGEGEDEKVDHACQHDKRAVERIHDREEDEGPRHEAREDPMRDHFAAPEGVDERAEV